MILAPHDLVARARGIAVDAHRGQVDKIGEPSLRHPARVAHRVRAHGPAYEAVAWLHDVVEDTDWTPGSLADAGFPSEVVDGVVAMTKQPGDSGPDAVQRACADPVALVVKAADVADNTDPERRRRLEPELADRLARKYDEYRRVLTSHGAPTFEARVELSDSELALLG